MSIRIDNLSKPDNTAWKKISDVLLYVLPVYLTTSLTLPIPEQYKFWINYGVTMIIVTLKGLSKFTSNTQDV